MMLRWRMGVDRALAGVYDHVGGCLKTRALAKRNGMGGERGGRKGGGGVKGLS